MKKIFASCLTAAVLAGCLTVPALARENFSDLPNSHWAYEDVMKVADAGIINGTGNNMFSPNRTLDAAQFLAMIARTCYDDAVTGQTSGSTWYYEYVEAAEDRGVLEGTDVTLANATEGITRYDMAMILANVGQDIIGATGAPASSDEIADFGTVPAEYQDAVLWAYGNGLLYGDNHGNFGGADTMTRAEAATVIARLMTLQGSTVTTPTEPVTPEPGEETRHMFVSGYTKYSDNKTYPEPTITNHPMELSLYYSADGKSSGGVLLATTTSDNTGYYEFDIEIPAKYYKDTGYDDNYYIAGGSITIDGIEYRTNPVLNAPEVEGTHFSYARYAQYDDCQNGKLDVMYKLVHYEG